MKKISTTIENLLLSVKSILKAILISRPFYLSKTKKKKVFILANGPSLNEVISRNEVRAKLVDEDVLCVNWFFKSPLFHELKPKYYIITASEFWTDFGSETYAPHINLFHALTKVNWKIDFYIPREAKKHKFWQDIVRENSYVNIVFFNATTMEGFSFVSNIIYKNKLGVPRSHNILGNSIMMMIWKGYKELLLIGVDHSWLKTLFVNDDNIAMLTDNHFYDKKPAPRIMRKLGRGRRKLHEIIHKFYLSFRAYFEIQEFAQNQGVKIINVTEQSYIDAFDRGIIDDYL